MSSILPGLCIGDTRDDFSSSDRFSVLAMKPAVNSEGYTGSSQLCYYGQRGKGSLLTAGGNHIKPDLVLDKSSRKLLHHVGQTRLASTVCIVRYWDSVISSL